MTELFNTKPQTVQRRKLRKNMPKGEQLLWHHLKNKQLGYKFRRQFGIGPYVADFYCPRLRLCIEVDGLSHADKDAQTHDTCRDAYMKSLGITVKRYVGGQVWHELDRVKQDIYNTCIQLEQRVPTSNKPPLAPPS